MWGFGGLNVNELSKASNADMETVKEVLSAVSRGPLDPDVELALTLFELSDCDDSANVEAALVRLANSARSNQS
jgi:hypothetical protein